MVVSVITDWKLKPADFNDISELYALQLLCFESEAEMIGSREVPALQETMEAFEKDFSNWITLKLTNYEDEIIGAIRFRRSGDIIEIGRLMIHPDYRRRGLAQLLINEVDLKYPNETKELYTCTRSWINIRLYDKCGFKVSREVTEDTGLSFYYMRKQKNDI